MLWLLFGFGCESTDKDRDGFSIFENDCDDNGVEGGFFEECDEENNQNRIDDLSTADD